MPNDCVRNALYAMSSSPECFFTLRNNFASSLATMGIGNWIMGIGDRHLSNLLICKNSGKIIGIDFECAFGMATRNLHIPEMVPLRLTPQFVKVISPMDTSGLIKKCMIYSLRAIRAERKTIMAAMAAYVAAGDPTASGNQTSTDRTNVVNKKLMGANPVHLIASDLKCGQISK